MTMPDQAPQTTQWDDELGKAIKKTANYLYAIEDSTIVGDIDPELFKDISMLRQLLNECFVYEKKSVSNQFLHDQLKPLLSKQWEQARREGRKEILDGVKAILDKGTWTSAEDRIAHFINAQRKEDKKGADGSGKQDL